MKIHSDVLTSGNIYDATSAAGMRGVDAEVIQRGSRSRKRGFDVKLSGTSNRWQNPGTGDRNVEHSATWDEWGMFINALYLIDPDAIVGPYKDLYDFEYKTCGRFESLTAPYAHGNHQWEYVAPRQFQCKNCEAQQNNN
jgi:hypothetical protein